MSTQTLLEDFIRVGFSSKDFYSVMNGIYLRFYGKHLMLHYPICRYRAESLLQCQKNLTDYCLTKLTSLRGREILEVGCGNGVQSTYILEHHNPARITGVDLSQANIALARKLWSHSQRLVFLVDDAQELSQIEDRSIDAVINIESAFHYPDKNRFLAQIYRVLKPSGSFIIADILNRDQSGSTTLSFWQRRMNLNHWTLPEYKNAFRANGLHLNHLEDLTPRILHGYRNTRIWSRTFMTQGLIPALMGYAWGKTMAVVNCLLLLTLRRYYLFAGGIGEP
jgi:ubiquinone/menaquinone biosynthesis C-methylase UbiE